jgi:SAM-dependent methyltransferase
MVNENIINQIREFSKKPPLFNKECGNIWTEEYIAKQMLKAHLNPDSDGASRRDFIINKTVDFLTKNVLKENSSVLDLGCGPGLYDEKLCQRGYKVTGIDFSINSINYAKNSAEKLGLNIKYKYNNFFELNYLEEFDTVMQIYGEINTFSDSERSKFFNIVNNSLKPNGLFIFDISTPTLRKKCRLKKNWYISESGFWRGKTHLVLEEGFQYDNDIWLDQYIVADNNGVQVYRNWFHDYTVKTISEIIQNSGFKIINMLGSLTGEISKEDSEWITVIAQKK